MSDYYGELGIASDASADELRRAYRERARRLHPDLNPGAGPDGDAMRRLNEAWRVLGDPVSRRRYDDSRRRQSRGPAAAEGDFPDRAGPGHPGAFDGRLRIRPAAWMVMVGVLAAIFIITAYAAGPAPTTPIPRTQTDQCLAHFPGYDAIVSCSQPNAGRVVTVVPTAAAAACPIGSTPKPILGRAEMACMAGGS